MALMEDVHKTASRQFYNFVMKGGNKKDKNGDLHMVKLGCTKRGEYKENVVEVREVGQGGRQRTRQRKGSPFKAYASCEDYEWYLLVKCPDYYHLPIAPNAFAANRKVSQANIVVVPDDFRA